jgi:predicted regulator of Ras-like GTPase activity (Roadblock/LC7/MglB family)
MKATANEQSSLAHFTRSPMVRSPEVTAMVVTDRAGALIEASGDVDGETSGAVYAVVAGDLDRLGETLGLGQLQRASITGPTTACIVAIHEDGVVAIQADPRKPLVALERRLDGVLRR